MIAKLKCQNCHNNAYFKITYQPTYCKDSVLRSTMELYQLKKDSLKAT